MTTSKPPYSDDFRARAVEMVSAGQPIAHVARTVGISRNTLKQWRDAPPPPQPSTAPAGRVSDAVATGSRLTTLIALRDFTAARIDAGIPATALPGNARLLAELMKEIETVERLEQGEKRLPDSAPFDYSQI